jgi:hypothetical protein
MPRAPPNSAPVSLMPDAAPARAGGAAPTMSSVVSPKTGARPSEMTTEASTIVASPSTARNLAEDREPDGRHEQTASDEVGGPDPLDDTRGELRTDDESKRRWQ